MYVHSSHQLKDKESGEMSVGLFEVGPKTPGTTSFQINGKTKMTVCKDDGLHSNVSVHTFYSMIAGVQDMHELTLSTAADCSQGGQGVSEPLNLQPLLDGQQVGTHSRVPGTWKQYRVECLYMHTCTYIIDLASIFCFASTG